VTYPGVSPGYNHSLGCFHVVVEWQV
jgi:hypothetical protein